MTYMYIYHTTPTQVIDIHVHLSVLKGLWLISLLLGLLLIDTFSLITQEQKHGLKHHKHQKIEHGKG